MHRVTLWRHRKKEESLKAAAADPAGSQRRDLLLKRRKALELASKRAMRKGDDAAYLTATRMLLDLDKELASLSEQVKLAHGPGHIHNWKCACGEPMPVWKITYEQPDEGSKEVTMARDEALVGIRQALGFTPAAARAGIIEPGKSTLSPQERDSKLVDDLAAAVERRQSDERFIASAMRLVSILQCEPLPADVETEIDRLEGSNGDAATVSGNNSAETESQGGEQ